MNGLHVGDVVQVMVGTKYERVGVVTSFSVQCDASNLVYTIELDNEFEYRITAKDIKTLRAAV